jgi:putative tricarboxylic transport membrane protein
MHRKYEIAFSLFIVLVVAWFVWQAVGSGGLLGPPFPRGWGQRSALFPLVIGIPTLALAILQLSLDVRGARASKVPPSAPVEAEVPPELARRRTIVILVTILGFVLLVWLVGFSLAIPISTLLYLRFGAGETWRLSLILTAIAGISFELIFVRGLNVPMPEGLLTSLFYLE